MVKIPLALSATVVAATSCLLVGCGTGSTLRSVGQPSNASSPAALRRSSTPSASIPATQPTHSVSPRTFSEPIHPVSAKEVVGNDMFNGAQSIWRDGNWNDPKTSLSGPRYVISFAGTGNSRQIPLIEVYNEDRTPYVNGVEWVDYVCPQQLGILRITSISKNGAIVYFVSEEGVHGSLNLDTRIWKFTSCEK